MIRMQIRDYQRSSVRLSLLWLALLVPGSSGAQSPVWDRWEPGVVGRLDTAADIPYMTAEEKKVVLFMNMARYNGRLFSETFLEAYVEEKKVERTRFLRTLERDLRKISGLPPLIPEKDLATVAATHAIRSGESGHVGHRDFNKRFKPLMGNPYQHVGENCSYGFETAIDIVITLLIDEGVEDTGHRKNILNEGFNSVGVAIRPHKRYRVNCVIDFGRQSRSNLNEVPY